VDHLLERFGYLVIGGVAALTTWLLTFGVRRLAWRIQAVVQPDERRVHDRATPTAGGTAMVLALLISLGIASQITRFKPIFQSTEPLGLAVAAGIIFIVGLVDDLLKAYAPRRKRPSDGVSAPAKVAGQVLAGTALVFAGATMFNFRIPFAGLVVLSADLSPLITVIWVIAMANAVNLIDGLDGLAAGIVAIAAAAFAIYGVRLSGAGLLGPENMGPLIAVITCGVCVGFLPHNVHPAKIFMGDAGALLLGLLMAVSTAVVGGRADQPFSGQTYFFYAPIFIPFFILGVPLLDTSFAVVRRAVRRSGVTGADKEHLHHRLMRLGHGQRRSVSILWAWTAILSGFVLYPTFTNRGNAVIPFGIAALGVALYTLFHPGIRQRTAEPAPLADVVSLEELGERTSGQGRKAR
jgi:UDP-GlcNAc:undecaprenyl-phosphate GlcNAc-1-phosphate transferase